MKIQCVPTQVRNFEEIKFLSDTAREKLNQPGGVTIANAITRSGLVLLCGYFEGFLREMCKEFVDIINDSGVSAKLLPLSMLSDHSESCLIKLNNRSETKFSQFVNSLVSDLPLSMNSKNYHQQMQIPLLILSKKYLKCLGLRLCLIS